MSLDLGAILTAMVTPFDAEGRVDEDAAVRLMHHLVDHGSDGRGIRGTTSQASTLDGDEPLAMIDVAVDDMLADVLEMGECGGILTGSHLFGDEMRRMVDEPDRRREIEAGLQDVYRDLGIAPAACALKAALNLLGLEVGAPRLPYVEVDPS